MNNFIYNIPTKVYFGENQLENLGKELRKFGRRVLLTYGGGSIKRIGLYDRVIEELRKAEMEVFELSGIEPNPRIESVRKGVEICKNEGIDVLLAVGGGSTIDATKFMAAGACVDHDAWEFFGANAKPIERALPIVTILTLSATGSEMDTGGVISEIEGRLQLRYFWFNYSKSGVFECKVDNDLKEKHFKYRFTGRNLGESPTILGANKVYTGKFKFPIQDNNDEVVITVCSDNVQPINLISGGWEGLYIRRNSSV